MDNEFLQHPFPHQLTSHMLLSEPVVADEEWEVVVEEVPKPSYDQMLVLLEQKKPAEFTLVRTQKHHNPVPFAQRQLHASQQHHFERTNTQKSLWAESYNDGVALSATSMVG